MLVNTKSAVEFAVNYALFDGLAKFNRDADALCKDFRKSGPAYPAKKRKKKK